ncbi:MAG TPA: peptidylprolyl isomerase [Eubacteriaceae bacterium]|nr:peptidylprolyl isomerase [Eubacteriaceae bacterium]
MKKPIVTIELKNGKKIEAELYPEKAPNTVNNFIDLIQKGYYDGLTFHRVIKGFMIQGGCPEGSGTGGPGYTIRGEFKANGFDNTVKHERGVLSMARTMQPNSAGSQFFIIHQNAPHLDGQYAAFGKVINGMEAVDEIADVKTGFSDKPVQPAIIERMTVDTLGESFDKPVVNEK